jgi:hypothetical protein
MATRRIGRNTKTGRFMPVSTAVEQPNTGVVEKIKVPPTDTRTGRFVAADDSSSYVGKAVAVPSKKR